MAADNGKELVLHVKPKAEDGAKECKVLLEAAQASGSPAVLGTLKDKHEGEWRGLAGDELLLLLLLLLLPVQPPAASPAARPAALGGRAPWRAMPTRPLPPARPRRQVLPRVERAAGGSRRDHR